LYSLAVKKLTAAKEVLNKLPPDSIDIVIEVWTRQVRCFWVLQKLYLTLIFMTHSH